MSFDNYINSIIPNTCLHISCKTSLQNHSLPKIYLHYKLRKLGINLSLINSCFMCNKIYIKSRIV